MNNTRPTRAHSFSLIPAAVLLASLAGSAAQAQVVALTAPPAGDTATTTSTFPLNDSNGGYIYGPQVSALGSANTATFTATNTPNKPGAASFETFDNSTGNGAPLAYPLNTVVLDTFDGGPGHTDTVTGPLDISFSSPVSSFGLTVESGVEDTATFSFTAYSGAVAPQNVIGTFTYAPVTQTLNGTQHSIFIGGQSVSNQIVNVVVSDTSNASGYTGGTNDFFFGPLSTYSPVPEASTTISFGLLLALGLGGVLIRRKTNAPKTTAL